MLRFAVNICAFLLVLNGASCFTLPSVCDEMQCFNEEEECINACASSCSTSGTCHQDFAGRLRQYYCDCSHDDSVQGITPIPDFCGALGCFTDPEECNQRCVTYCSDGSTCVNNAILDVHQHFCICHSSLNPEGIEV